MAGWLKNLYKFIQSISNRFYRKLCAIINKKQGVKRSSKYLQSPREHILSIDNSLGGHLSKLYGHNDEIFNFYLGSQENARVQVLWVSILPSYKQKLLDFLEQSAYAEFDRYMIVFLNFIRDTPQFTRGVIIPELNLKKVGENKYAFSFNSGMIFYFEQIEETDFESIPVLPGDIYQPFIIELYNIEFYTKLSFNFLPIAKLLTSLSFWTVTTVLVSSYLYYDTPNFIINNIFEGLNKIALVAKMKLLLNWLVPISLILVIGHTIWRYIIYPIKKYFRIYITTKIIDKYSTSNKYSDYFTQKTNEDYMPLEFDEYALSHPKTDIFGFHILVAHFYYTCIYNLFVPEFNKIIIIDDKRGMGKSTFINYLVQRINGITYRGNDYCALFHQILFDKQISVVQLSVMSFLSMFSNHTATAEDEVTVIINLLKFIASNIDTDQSKLIYKLIANIETIKYKDFSIKFLQKIRINNQDSFVLLKEKLRKQEQPCLLIIEDIDRLNKQQLGIFVHFLWFIYDLPFTITILPGEKRKLIEAINLNNNSNEYEEAEQYKVFQKYFSIKAHIYPILARQISRHYKDEDYLSLFSGHNLIINNAIRLSNNNMLTNDKLKESLDDWTKLLFDEVEYKVLNDFELSYKTNQGIQKLSLRNYNNYLNSLENAFIKDIEHIFMDFEISLREFKYIIKRIHSWKDRLFGVQQLLLYMLEYRYSNNPQVKGYSKNYIYSHDPSIKSFPLEKKIKSNRLIGLPDECTRLIKYLENYPNIQTYNGISLFITRFFRELFLDFQTYEVLNIEEKETEFLFNRLFIRIILCNGQTPQNIYKSLSVDWYSQKTYIYNSFGSNLQTALERMQFIVLFNDLATKSLCDKLANRYLEPKYLDLNIYLLQNMAINFIRLFDYDDRPLISNEISQRLKDCFELKAKDLILYDNVNSKNIIICFPTIFLYFRMLFNLKRGLTQPIYDESRETLKENIDKIKNILHNAPLNTINPDKVLKNIF